MGRSMVAEAFPQHLNTYDGYENHIQRVDFARAAMMFLHGGLYADMDVQALASPFPHLPPGKVSVVASPYTRNERHQNSMMASPPRHPFWCALADEAVRRRASPDMYTTTWQLTGPQLLDAVVDTMPEAVHALPVAEFNPPTTSPLFHAPCVITRHLCTSVWTHTMDIESMRLYQAAQKGDTQQAMAAVKDGADLSCSDYAGLTPLHHAALKGNADMVSLLITHRAYIDSCDTNNTTAMHYGVQIGSVPVVRTLLECRASTNIKLREGTCAGQTAADLARVTLKQNQNPSSSRAILELLGEPVKVSGALGTTKGREQPWWAAATRKSTASGQKQPAQPSVQAVTQPLEQPSAGNVEKMEGQHFERSLVQARLARHRCRRFSDLHCWVDQRACPAWSSHRRYAQVD